MKMPESPVFTMSQVLPHTGHMLLIDELVQHDETGVVTALTIRPETLFCDGVTGVPAWVGLEYMAQTACAYSGVDEARAGQRASISLLLGSRSFKAHIPIFPIGSRLLVEARLLMRDENDLVAFRCSIKDAVTNAELAAGDIKAIRPANLDALIKEQLND